MMKLTHVRINKYKSFIKAQEIEISDEITAIVGMNESGKTAFLEALAKFNYFDPEAGFEFSPTLDYPRRELKSFQRKEEPQEVIRCTFRLSPEIIKEIESRFGNGCIKTPCDLTLSVHYGEKSNTWSGLHVQERQFIEKRIKKAELSAESAGEIEGHENIRNLVEKLSTSENQETRQFCQGLNTEILDDCWEWENALSGHVAKNIIKPQIPKFWYFDEYYALPSRININAVIANRVTQNLTAEEMRTAKALFELAGIDSAELLNTSDFESFVSELEATSNEITDKMFEYWSSNQNLEIQFAIENVRAPNNSEERVLDIRVRNQRHRVSLPLRNRSKGFNWFFSFVVWFSKVQADPDSSYILLLDEPGLNLHASAQGDLLRYIEDLSSDYMIVYTTHSPFMIDPSRLDRVRTVFDSKSGSRISDAISEKDPSTLFPLQAALGYDIAQNLFVSKKNLLVEGPSDLLYLTVMSDVLRDANREGLQEDITIVPVGGLDKVASFVSLFRGSKLKLTCLLDSFTDQSGKQRLDHLVNRKIIQRKNVLFFDQFLTGAKRADIEDLFDVGEYLKLFNAAFQEYKDLCPSDLSSKVPCVIVKINEALSIKRFNHYRPASYLISCPPHTGRFGDSTLDRFEAMFKVVNSLY